MNVYMIHPCIYIHIIYNDMFMKFMKCFWMYHSLLLIWNWQMIEVASPSW